MEAKTKTGGGRSRGRRPAGTLKLEAAAAVGKGRVCRITHHQRVRAVLLLSLNAPRRGVRAYCQILAPTCPFTSEVRHVCVQFLPKRWGSADEELALF